ADGGGRAVPRAEVANQAREVVRESFDQLAVGGAGVAAGFQLGENGVEAHPREVAAVAGLLGGAGTGKRVRHQRRHESAAGGLDVVVHADADVLMDLHLGRVATGAVGAAGDLFAAPGD